MISVISTFVTYCCFMLGRKNLYTNVERQEEVKAFRISLEKKEFKDVLSSLLR